MTNANIDFNKGIDVVALIEKLDEALEPFYAPSKVLPNDIETTLRDARICLKCYLDIIKHRDAEIENLKGIVNRQRSVLISRHFEILRLREKVASLKERNGGQTNDR